MNFLNEHLDYNIVGTNVKIFDRKKMIGIWNRKESLTEKDRLKDVLYSYNDYHEKK